MNKFREVARLLISCLFMATGVMHASRPNFFAHSIQQYQLTTFEQTGFIAVMLPLAQITIGVFLLLKVWERTMFAQSSLVFGVFAIAGTIALTANLDISCGCLGEYSPKLSILHVCITGLLCLISLRFATLSNWGEFDAI